MKNFADITNISVLRIKSRGSIQISDIFVKNTDPGSRLKKIRDFFELDQKKFSEILGLRQNYLSRYENGVHEFTDTLKLKLVDVIGKKYQKRVNLDWFVSGNGEMFLSEGVSNLIDLDKSSLTDDISTFIDRKLEIIEAEIAEIKGRLTRSNTDFPDSGLFVSEPEPEYDTVRVCSVDNVAAGPPIPQSEDLSTSIEVPRRLIKTEPDDYYVARVRGESMFAAGIPDGCRALIRKSDVPRNGAIQVVRCGGRSTLKRLQEHEDHRWTLNYEDDTNRSIELGPDEDYQIQGDFVAVLPDVQ